jgi:hypothetical protein
LLMKTWNSMKISSAVVAAVLLVAAQAQGTIAYNFPATPDSTVGGIPRQVGNIFTVNPTPGGFENALVTKVGAADYGAPGFIGSVPVAIYSWSGSQWNIVPGTSHTFSGTPSPGDMVGGAAFYTLPTPVTLTPGVYAIIGANFGSDNPYWNAGSGSHTDPSKAPSFGGGPYLTMGGVSGNRGWIANGSTLLPNLSGGGFVNYGAGLFGGNPGTPSFAGATFDFTPVPEAAAFGAAAVGLLGLVYIGRYARLRRTMKFS